MSDAIITAENLGKSYFIGAHRFMAKRLSEVLNEAIQSPIRHFKRLAGVRTQAEQIWALKDVSFSINKGEIVGIIGSNGAGKSTLLKILSRITDPTEGSAIIRGKLGSLLEVGIGFHPDLTGRENIYLNGIILGMSKAEVSRKFDEIIAFAEVEKFIDTPMKHYSSGMYVRLAFAVAAHLEPDILIIDEVLAVGDASFQQKCLGKISDVAKDGRTVLFVSHNMPAVLSLCDRALMLESGKLAADGRTRDVLDKYLEKVDEIATIPLQNRVDRKGDQSLKIVSCELRNNNNLSVPCVFSGENITLAIKYEAKDDQPLHNVHLTLELYGQFHQSLFQVGTNLLGADFTELPASGFILLKIPDLPLQPGHYPFDIYCTVEGEMADYVQNASVITVEAGDFYGSGKLPQLDHGPLLIKHSWSAGELFVERNRSKFASDAAQRKLQVG